MDFSKLLVTRERILLGLSPLLDESEFTAEAHMDLIEEILIRFEKSLENVICITGDNCATNAKIARLAKVPLVGMSVSDISS
jgi:hypothetical protein